MADWANDDINLLTWRAETNATAFEEQPLTDQNIEEQTYYDQGILMVAMVKAGVELWFDSTQIRERIGARIKHLEAHQAAKEAEEAKAAKPKRARKTA